MPDRSDAPSAAGSGAGAAVTDWAAVPASPMLLPHLQAGERVLWQQPTLPAAQVARRRGMRQMAGAAIGIGVGLWVLLIHLSWTILAEDFAADPGGALGGVAVLWLLLGTIPVPVGVYFWRQAGGVAEPGLCALTDRRMVQVAGPEIRLSEPWLFVRQVEAWRSGPGYGSVNWRIIQELPRPRKGEAPERPTIYRIGFEDLADPEAVAEVLRQWHAERRDASAAMLQRFLAAAAEGRLAEAEQAGDAWTLTAPAQGFAITFPGDWQASVDHFRFVGPVPVGTGWQAWAPGAAEWNALLALAPMDAGMRLILRDGPLDRGFEEVRDSVWEGLTAGSLVAAEAELRIGPLSGFAVTRLGQDTGLPGISLGYPEVMRREVWLDAGRRHFHISLVAGAKDAAAQRALNAIVASLRPG